MGVSGCGKSTVGKLLAQALPVEYAEGDEFHHHAQPLMKPSAPQQRSATTSISRSVSSSDS
ncbi:shikimate kinase [Nocardia australiensis]|uniref:shikimate kinase n=1 Tax=Nocardia australiensis TaxID=2887191 RepID=UPI00355908A9